MSEPVVIIGSLNDSELQKSIDELVSAVAKGTSKMKQNFDETIDGMKRKLQELGNVNVTAGDSSDGGSRRRSASQSQEERAVRNTTKAYQEQKNTLDQIATATQQASRQGSGDFLSRIRAQNAELESWRNFPHSAGNFGQMAIQRIVDDFEQQIPKLKQEIQRVKSEIEKSWNSPFHGGDYGLIDRKRLSNELQEYERALAQTSEKEKQETQAITEQTRAISEQVQERNKLKSEIGSHQLNTNISNEEFLQQAKALREAKAAQRTQGTQNEIQEVNDLKTTIAGLLNIRREDVILADSETDSIKKLTAILHQLKAAYEKLSAKDRSGEKGQDIVLSIHELERALQQIRAQASRPINMKEIINMPEKTIDDLTYKLQKLNEYKRGLNFDTQKKEIEEADRQIKRLNDDLTKYMGQGKRVGELNNALARSWNYMKNRLAFYFTIGASVGFVKELIKIRGEYEMLNRSLGVLIDSAERGTEVFNELSNMALISPYTLIELGQAARQLTAYGVAAKDVVETTKRIADMAAAVGAPIERLTYALGHVQTYGFLNSLQARQFINAGIPIVKELASMYSELEGRIVSVADVYDRMKHKAVSYADVMKVINDMTDEGGRFFDYQAKVADTLKVQLANLTLAWNNMLNDIGESEQGAMSTVIKSLKELFLHWKELKMLLLEIATGYTAVRVAQFTYLVGTHKATKATALANVTSKKFVATLANLKRAFMSLISSPLFWFTALATAAMGAWFNVAQVNEAIRELNESIRSGGQENFKNIQDFLDENSNILEKLKGGSGGSGEGLNKREAEKLWTAIREEIELTTKSSEHFIGTLLGIKDVNERVRQGFSYLERMRDVSGLLDNIGDKTIKVQQDWSQWWNLWSGNDSMYENVQDFKKAIDFVMFDDERFGKTFESFQQFEDMLGEIKKKSEETGRSIEETINNTTGLSDAQRSAFRNYLIDLENLRTNLDATSKSIVNFLSGQDLDPEQWREAYAQITDKIVQDSNMSQEEQLQYRIKQEESFLATRKAAFDADREYQRSQASKMTKQELNERLKAIDENEKAWLEAFGKSTAASNAFYNMLRTQHRGEIDKMFGHLTTKEIDTLDQSVPKWREWAKENAKEFSERFGVSFQELWNMINDTNRMKIFIRTTLGIEIEKSEYDTLKTADQKIDEAWQKIQRLKQRFGEIKNINTEDAENERLKITDELAAAQKDYNDALKEGGHSKKENAAATKAHKQAESELQIALKEEISLIDKVRSSYKQLTKEGVNSQTAITAATSGFDETVAAINKTLNKYGIGSLDITKYAGVSNPRAVLDMLQSQLNHLSKSGLAKPAEIKDLQVKVKDLKLDVINYNQKTIVDSLNNELGKIKDDYELAIELNADPEMGDMFADVFGINVNALPKTFAEAYEKVNEIAKSKLKENGLGDDDLKDFDLMSANIHPDEEGLWMGMEFSSNFVKALLQGQKAWQDVFKKNMVAVEKILDDYVKKYGDMSDKLGEIESNRLEKIKQLNDQYNTDELKKKPEYQTKLRAINEMASREAQQAEFDQFKNSRYYTMMFENLDYISTKTIRDMRDKLRELMDTMNGLKPEQLKQIISQYEKLEEKLAKRNPFKSFGKNVVDYFKTSKDRKKANEDFRIADKEYQTQLKIVGGLKVKKEQLEHNQQTQSEEYKELVGELNVSQEILDILKGQVDEAEKKADKYNLIKKAALQEAAAMGNMVAENLQSLGELRDFIQDDLGVELNEDINGMVDGLMGVGAGISSIVSAAESGNVVGIITGVGKTVTGLVDAVGSIFGGGTKDTYTPFLEGMQAMVDALTKINDRLMKTLSEMSGGKALAYYDKIMANDKRIEQNYMEAARRYGESGASWKSHSHNYNTNKRLSDDLDDISRVAGQEINAIQDFYTLSAKQLEDIMLGLPNVWLEIDEEQRQWFEKIIEMQDDVEEHAKGLSEALTGINIDTLKSDFESLLSDLSTEFDDFGDNIEETMRNAVIRGLMVNTYAKELKQWQATFDAYMSDGILSPEEAQRLKEWYLDLARRAMGDRDAAFAALGLDKEDEKKLSNLQQGIQGITEETAGALEAYMNGVSQQMYLQTDVMMQIRDAVVALEPDAQIATQAQILLQLQQSYAVQMAIRGILEGWSNASGMAMRVEMI